MSSPLTRVAQIWSRVRTELQRAPSVVAEIRASLKPLPETPGTANVRSLLNVKLWETMHPDDVRHAVKMAIHEYVDDWRDRLGLPSKAAEARRKEAEAEAAAALELEKALGESAQQAAKGTRTLATAFGAPSPWPPLPLPPPCSPAPSCFRFCFPTHWVLAASPRLLPS